MKRAIVIGSRRRRLCSDGSSVTDCPEDLLIVNEMAEDAEVSNRDE